MLVSRHGSDFRTETQDPAMIYATPLGYSSHPPVALPPINRRALMQNAHRIGQARSGALRLELPRGALLRSYGGLGAGEEPREIRPLSLAGRALRAAHRETHRGNRRATRRTGSSMIG